MYCDNCDEKIIDEPIEGEIEINKVIDGIEMDIPVIRNFCCEECKKEFFNEID